MRLQRLFGEERDLEVLIRSLARKFLKEKTTELPSSVLAGISGVSREEWDRIFSERRNFLSEMLTLPVMDTCRRLELLDGEERNFVDKLDRILRIMYEIYTGYPELLVLFHNIALDPMLNARLDITNTRDALREQAFEVLKRQAAEEEVVEKGSTMEKLLFFLLKEMMESYQNRLIEYCREYVECRNPSVFPEEDDMVSEFMDPMKSQLEGFTAV